MGEERRIRRGRRGGEIRAETDVARLKERWRRRGRGRHKGEEEQWRRKCVCVSKCVRMKRKENQRLYVCF